MASCDNGHVNPDANRFCQECGLVVADSRSPAATAPPPFPHAPNTQNQVWEASPNRSIWRGRRAVTLAIAGGALLVVGGVLLLTGSPTPTTTMTITLDVYNDFDGCDLGPDYRDIPGSEVVVKKDGAVVGSTSLGRVGEEDFVKCSFRAQLDEVPTDGDNYEIAIAGRGSQEVSREDLAATKWNFTAKLGL